MLCDCARTRRPIPVGARSSARSARQPAGHRAADRQPDLGSARNRAIAAATRRRVPPTRSPTNCPSKREAIASATSSRAARPLANTLSCDHHGNVTSGPAKEAVPTRAAGCARISHGAATVPLRDVPPAAAADVTAGHPRCALYYCWLPVLQAGDHPAVARGRSRPPAVASVIGQVSPTRRGDLGQGQLDDLAGLLDEMLASSGGRSLPRNAGGADRALRRDQPGDRWSLMPSRADRTELTASP